jgi:prepilin-type N-terminal cleavage/methylation domain-containing protein
MKTRSKGFTLIELLIVIALLGALAVGLLAALDPFEQLKKGTDTGVRNLVSEFHGAVIRYYALKSEMPWCPSGTCGTTPSGLTLNDSSMVTYIDNIAQAGELKTNFSQLAGNNLIKVKVTAGADTIKVCFSPTSKSFKCDPNTKYDQYGELNATCGDPATCGTMAPDTCYWCVQ